MIELFEKGVCQESPDMQQLLCSQAVSSRQIGVMSWRCNGSDRTVSVIWRQGTEGHRDNGNGEVFRDSGCQGLVVGLVVDV